MRALQVPSEQRAPQEPERELLGVEERLFRLALGLAQFEVGDAVRQREEAQARIKKVPRGAMETVEPGPRLPAGERIRRQADGGPQKTENSEPEEQDAAQPFRAEEPERCFASLHLASERIGSPGPPGTSRMPSSASTTPSRNRFLLPTRGKGSTEMPIRGMHRRRWYRAAGLLAGAFVLGLAGAPAVAHA